MKRFAVLALAAVFAFSFTASVAAAPEFSGSFTVNNELDLGADAIDVAGDGPDLTFSLGAGEEGIWSLSVDLGSALTDGATIGQLGSDVDSAFAADSEANGAYLTDKITANSGTYYKDLDGNYYGSTGAKLGAAAKAAVNREIALDKLEWESLTDPVKVDVTAPELALGAYELSITPGAFSLVVAGNGAAPNTADLFGFIESDDEPDDPKFQLTTDVAGVGLTAEYETGGDALYAFASTALPGIGDLGVAFTDGDLADTKAGMGVSADISADLMGFATLSAGVAFDMNVEKGNDALAFAVGAEAPVIEGLVVDASYENDGRNAASDAHTQVISGGLDYGDGMLTASASSKTTAEDDKATLTLKGAVEYPVIADVFTVSASVESIADEDSALNAIVPTAYKWDGLAVGDILAGRFTIKASADYVVNDAITVTPSFQNQSFTFTNEKTGSIATFGVEGTYAFSDSASLTVGFENATGDAVADVVPEVKSTTLSTGFSVSF